MTSLDRCPLAVEREMLARVGELGRGQRLAAHQRRQHGRAGGVADQRGDLDDIGGNHGRFYRRATRRRQARTVRHRPNRCRTTAKGRSAADNDPLRPRNFGLEENMKRTALRVEPISTYLERYRKGSRAFR